MKVVNCTPRTIQGQFILWGLSFGRTSLRGSRSCEHARVFDSPSWATAYSTRQPSKVCELPPRRGAACLAGPRAADGEQDGPPSLPRLPSRVRLAPPLE